MENVKLTEKEIQVIELKSDGNSHREISKAIHTNREYIRQIFCDLYKRSNTKNSAQLTKWAIERGYLKINCQKLCINDDRAA